MTIEEESTRRKPPQLKTTDGMIRMYMSLGMKYPQILAETNLPPEVVWSGIDRILALHPERAINPQSIYSREDALPPSVVKNEGNKKDDLEDEDNSEAYVQAKTDSVEPRTLFPLGKEPTRTDVAVIENQSSNILKLNEISKIPEKISPAERMFMKGLGLGDFYIHREPYAGKDSILIRTQSENDFKRNVIRDILSKQGNLLQRIRPTVVLDAEKYGFMQNPQVTDDELSRKVRYAPFVLGLMMGKFKGEDFKFSDRDINLMRNVYEQYTNHYGFDMGKFYITDSHGIPLAVIKVIGVRDVIEPLCETAREANMLSVDEAENLLLNQKAA